MSVLGTLGVREQHRPLSDRELVGACLEGNEQAWAALIDKYKRLIFSIPVKYGLRREDAADVFQAVCLDLVAELRHLREPQALPKWLIQTAAHRCFKYKRQEQRYITGIDESATEPPAAPVAEVLLHEVEQEQALREAINALSSRCRLMIEMLFFESPARPYHEVAARLGLATGSIGFIRGRCLERLRAALERMGM